MRAGFYMEGGGMAVKLLMTWDIVPGREQEYFEFVVREFVPGMQRLGITPTEAWYTTYGKRPQILTGGITETMKAMQEARQQTPSVYVFNEGLITAIESELTDLRQLAKSVDDYETFSVEAQKRGHAVAEDGHEALPAHGGHFSRSESALSLSQGWPLALVGEPCPGPLERCGHRHQRRGLRQAVNLFVHPFPITYPHRLKHQPPTSGRL